VNHERGIIRDKGWDRTHRLDISYFNFNKQQLVPQAEFSINKLHFKITCQFCFEVVQSFQQSWMEEDIKDPSVRATPTTCRPATSTHSLPPLLIHMLIRLPLSLKERGEPARRQLHSSCLQCSWMSEARAQDCASCAHTPLLA